MSTTPELTRPPEVGISDLGCRPVAAEASRVASGAGWADSTVARLLHPAARPVPLTAGLLRRLVDDLATSIRGVQGPLLEPLAGPRAVETGPQGGSGERRFRRLVTAPQLEVWLIEWGKASLLELHDHGGSSGAVRVLEGSLVEVSTDVEASRPLERRILGPGAGFSYGTNYVHELWNPRDEPALSLHAYSPPLASMTFYRLDGRDLGAVRTDRY